MIKLIIPDSLTRPWIPQHSDNPKKNDAIVS